MICLRCLLFLSFLLITSKTLAQQPNIIFILTDDQGYGDVGVLFQDARTDTQKFDTPELDQLAAEGAILSHHYCPAPVCAPSRASLLQGVHQGHADVRNNQFDKALADNHTLASVLRAAGYYTAHVGKNGLAGGEGSVNFPVDDASSLAGHPLYRGFDHFFGMLFHNDGHHHYPQNGTTSKKAFVVDDFSVVTSGTDLTYTADLWTAKTKQIIKDQHAANTPFFIYLAYDTPHNIMQVPTVAYPAFKSAQGTNAISGGLQWTGSAGSPPFVNTAVGTRDSYIHPDFASTSWPTAEKKFAGMIRRLDNCVGDILQLLKDLGIDDETLVIFTSDNGPTAEDHSAQFFDSFGPLDGIKRDLWEGGIRMPTLAWMPGTIPAGRMASAPSAFYDWMPTFSELAGLSAPARSDGVSLVPSLTGVGSQRESTVYIEYQVAGSTPNYTEFEANKRGRRRGQMQAIRLGDFKGVRYDISDHNDDFEIYNVVTDAKETTNLAASMPVLQLQMKNRVLQVRRTGGGVTRPYDDVLIPAVGLVGSNGLHYACYEGDWPWVPQFDSLTPAASGTSSSLDLSVRTREDQIGMAFEGFIQIPTAGDYTFYLQSDTGAVLRIHDALLIDDDYNHNGSERSGTIKLAGGLHPIRLAYHHEEGPHALQLSYAGPGLSKQVIPDDAFFLNATIGEATNIAFRSGFEYGGGNPVVNSNVTADVLDGADDQVGNWSGLLPDSVASDFPGGESAGFVSFAGNQQLFLDRPSLDLKLSANLARLADLQGAIVSFDCGVRRVLNSHLKDIPIIGYDSESNEVFHIVLSGSTTPGEKNRIGVRQNGSAILWDLPTDSGADSDVDVALNQAGAAALSRVQLDLLAGTYTIRLTRINGSSYVSAPLAYNGRPINLSRVEFTVNGGASVNNGSGLFLDEVDVRYSLPAASTSDLLVHLPLNGDLLNAGTTGGLHDGMLQGSTAFASGKLGQGLTLDGTGDYTTHGTPPLSGATPRTSSIWVNTTASGMRSALTMGGNGNGLKWDMDIDGPNGGTVELGVGGGRSTGSGVSVIDGQWHLYTVTFDDDNLNDVRFYVDGIFQYQGNADRAIATNPNGVFYLGSAANSGGFQPFSGLLDDAAIWQTALSADEVKCLYEVGQSTNLHYDAGVFDQLIQVHDQQAAAYSDASLNWTRVGGLSGPAGLSGSDPVYTLTFDGTNGTGLRSHAVSSGVTLQGTPYSWLVLFNLVSGGDYEAADLADIDSDSMAAWEEYIAGTDPRDKESLLVILERNYQPIAHAFTFEWPSSSGRSYSVSVKTNLRDAAWMLQASGLLATPPINSHTIITNVSPLHIRVGIE